MTTTITDYYQAGWREQLHTCPACDWQGNSRAMEMELHDEQTEYACPGCEMPLLIVLHPGIDRIRAAAEAGNAEAREQLDLIAAYRQRD